jgi:23S rRNA pseudouridine1911/1915/1917 synthase
VAAVREEIPVALEGERLDRAVALLSGRSRAEVAAAVDAGAVRLDGRVVGVRGRRVRAGQTLDAELPDPVVPARPVPDPTVVFAVVHEDPDVVVVDKPPGLVVHPGAGNRAGTLVNGLLARFPDIARAVETSPARGGGRDDVAAAERPGIVHRLDRGTSGLLVVARTPEARRALIDALAQRRVERRYLAMVHGHVDADEGVVDAPLARADRDPTRVAVHAAGRPARTHYTVLDRLAEPVVSLLALRLETGRTHQIRVHLAAIGHPVVGDDRYGPSAAWQPLPPGRVFLHAAHLAFRHPRTGVPLHFEAPLADDLAAVLAALRR